MPEIANGLLAIAGVLICVVAALLGVVIVLSSQLEEQRKTNALSERMARVMESDE